MRRRARRTPSARPRRSGRPAAPEALRQPLPDLRGPFETSAPRVLASRCLQHAVVGEEAHDPVQVMGVERVQQPGEGLCIACGHAFSVPVLTSGEGVAHRDELGLRLGELGLRVGVRRRCRSRRTAGPAARRPRPSAARCPTRRRRRRPSSRPGRRSGRGPSPRSRRSAPIAVAVGVPPTAADGCSAAASSSDEVASAVVDRRRRRRWPGA